MAEAPKAIKKDFGSVQLASIKAFGDVRHTFAECRAQIFLGINFKCNPCHDSFISKWKLKDAYALAAYFSAEEKISSTGLRRGPTRPVRHRALHVSRTHRPLPSGSNSGPARRHRRHGTRAIARIRERWPAYGRENTAEGTRFGSDTCSARWRTVRVGPRRSGRAASSLPPRRGGQRNTPLQFVAIKLSVEAIAFEVDAEENLRGIC